MTATVADPADLDGIENRALPHILTEDGILELPQSSWHLTDAIPSTGVIVSSANDMAKWCSYQIHAGVPAVTPSISDGTLHDMRTVHVSGVFDWFPAWGYGRSRAGYGLGWKLFDYRDDSDQHVTHGGATRGMQAWMVVSQNHDYAIAMMSNAGWAGDRVHFAIANWIHDQYLGLEPVDWTGEKLKAYRVAFDKWLADREPKKPKNTSLPPSFPLSHYAGTYEHPMLEPILVTPDKDQLVVEMGVLQATAEHWGGDVFYIDWANEAPNGFLTFSTGSRNIVTALTYDDGWTNDFQKRSENR
jgi:hypothetical protein